MPVCRQVTGLLLLFTLLLVQSGCEIMPVTRLRPVVENPYPEIQTVAVLPFSNQTNDPSVDVMEVARCYAAEVQKIGGFTVISVDTVAAKMKAAGITSLNSVEEVRLLCRILGVDGVFIGRVNIWSDQSPLELGITVEWYATNQYFQPSPTGHGLPWGTTREEEIPAPLISAAERELAKAQLATQTPEDPEGEAAYAAFCEEMERKEQLAQFSQGLPQTPSTEPRRSTAAPVDSDYDEDSNEFEQYDSERESYRQLQQMNIDNEFAKIHGDKTTIRRGTHNLKVNTRNIEEVKRRIAELLKDEDPDVEVGVPLESPMPEGLEHSDWIRRHRHRETLQEQMHRTHKPELPPEAFAQPSAQVYPPNYGGTIPPSLSAYQHYAVPQYAPYQNVQPYTQQNIHFTPAAIASETDGEAQKYGFMVHHPSDPETGAVSGNAIFLEVDSNGNIARAFMVDTDTEELGEEIALSVIGLDQSTLSMTVPPVPMYQHQMPGMIMPNGQMALEPESFPGLPSNWPDPRGFISDGPRREKPTKLTPSLAPICALTKHYSADDASVTQALEDYHFHFRDSEMIGGWQKVLRDRKAFITFCCRMHIWEILSSRGGAREAVEVKRTWKTWIGTTNP